MQANLKAVGIPLEYGGPHNNHATEMALTSFPDGSYLELIAIQANADPKALAAHYWSKYMKGSAGPAAWAVRPRDLQAEVQRLRTAGIAVTEPVRAGRERPDGTRLDWETSNTGTEPNGVFFPFEIRDFTPREQRAFPSGAPTTEDFGGISKVVIAVRNLEAAIEQYRKAYALPEPIIESGRDSGARIAWFAGTPVVLMSPFAEDSWSDQRLGRFGEGPCAFILKATPKSRSYKTASKSRWFGAEVSWFDESVLGWHLGFE
jgi:hypothetical protein